MKMHNLEITLFSFFKTKTHNLCRTVKFHAHAKMLYGRNEMREHALRFKRKTFSKGKMNAFPFISSLKMKATGKGEEIKT